MGIHAAIPIVLHCTLPNTGKQRLMILIKKYANRKLYDTHHKRYVTLAGIATLIQQGAAVTIRDNDTGEDLTVAVLAQIVAQQAAPESQPHLQALLTRLIRSGSRALHTLRDQAATTPPPDLTQLGIARRSDVLALQHQLDDLQHILDHLLQPELTQYKEL